VSLRLRLLVASGLVALIALVAADVATYSALHSFLYSRVDQTLLTAAAQGPHPPPQGNYPSPEEGGNGFDNPPPVSTPGLSSERLADGKEQWQYPAYETDGHRYWPQLSASMLSAARARGGRQFFTTGSTTPDGPQFRVLVTTYPDGDQLVLGQPLDATVGTLHRLLLVELAVTAAALVAAVVLGLWLVRVGLQPLREVEDTAEAIAEGDLSRRVPGEENRTEVGRLARVLNTMLGRIQQAFAERDATEAELRHSEERMRRFVADASHELRTPLAAVTAYAELYDRGASEHPEDLERVMAGISAESARMKRLVDDLLLLARLDEGRPLERRPTELVALAADAVQAASAVGPDWPVRLVADQPVEVMGDPERLRQVLDNLLANVRAHTPRGTGASVQVRTEGPTAVVEVVDEGPGLSPQEASRVFERFYRSDPSRSRGSGGTGLGLSIVGAIVAAHGGTVSVAPGPHGGALFAVRLPMTPDADFVDPGVGRSGDVQPAAAVGETAVSSTSSTEAVPRMSAEDAPTSTSKVPGSATQP
jgi:two-component system OmpR family sensor kinase